MYCKSRKAVGVMLQAGSNSMGCSSLSLNSWPDKLLLQCAAVTKWFRNWLSAW